MQILDEKGTVKKEQQADVKTLPWFVVYTNPKAEKKVAERLTLAGHTCYLPLVTEWKQWSDRKKKVQRPLISSVVFVQCQPEELLRVFTVFGVNRVLRYLGKPAVVQAQEILNLKIVLQEVLDPLFEEVKLLPGTTVEVVNGPFKGLIGTAVQELNGYRIRIELHHLSLAFGVNVPKSFVRAL